MLVIFLNHKPLQKKVYITRKYRVNIFDILWSQKINI